MKGCCEIKLNPCLCCFSAQAGLWVAAHVSPSTALSICLNHLCVLGWCLVILQTQSPHGPGTVSCWDRSISKAVMSAYTIHVEWHKLNIFHYPGTYTERKYVKCSMWSHVFFKLPWLSSFNIFIVSPPLHIPLSPFWKAWNSPLELKMGLKTLITYTVQPCQNYRHFCIWLRELCVF